MGEEEIAITLPQEIDGLVIRHKGQTMTLRAPGLYRLKRALYGYRRAPSLWQQYLTKTFTEKCGLTRSHVDPSAFYKTDDTICMVVVHVDDVAIIGLREKVDQIILLLGETVTLKPAEYLAREGDTVTMLGRTIRRTATGFRTTSCKKLVANLVEELDLTTAKPTPTPAVRYGQ
jgi:hypothetical protein